MILCVRERTRIHLSRVNRHTINVAAVLTSCLTCVYGVFSLHSIDEHKSTPTRFNRVSQVTQSPPTTCTPTQTLSIYRAHTSCWTWTIREFVWLYFLCPLLETEIDQVVVISIGHGAVRHYINTVTMRLAVSHLKTWPIHQRQRRRLVYRYRSPHRWSPFPTSENSIVNHIVAT